jgi:hypothetical protein
MFSNDPKHVVANSVSLRRAKDENEAIRVMDKGTPAEQKALVEQMKKVFEV